MDMLKVENLCFCYKEFSIKNISFELKPGYIMGFIGRNGSGKTTTMRLIMNAIDKDNGRVTINGFDNVEDEIDAKNQIGFIMEDIPFIPNMTIQDNGCLLGEMYDNWSEQRFKELLKLVNLESHYYDKQLWKLSTGEYIRFQLAFGLAHKPRLLLLDEPTGGLDPVFRIKFLELIQELIKEENISVLFSTHITSDLDKVADYITMIDDGEIIFSLSKEELMDKYMIIKGSKDNIDKLPKENVIFVIHTKLGSEAMVESYLEIKSNVENLNLVTQRPDLETVMYYIIKRRRL